jgi:hypothetical protein
MLPSASSARGCGQTRSGARFEKAERPDSSRNAIAKRGSGKTPGLVSCAVSIRTSIVPSNRRGATKTSSLAANPRFFLKVKILVVQ